MIRKLVRWIRGTCPYCGAKLESVWEGDWLSVWCPRCTYEDGKEYH